MDEFVGFEFVLLDASAGKVKVLERGPRRERIDLIARQFRDFLRDPNIADDAPHGLMMTHDFKLRRQVGKSAGWLTFLVDRGDGKQEVLEEVATVAFARSDDAEADRFLKKVAPYINLADLPRPPFAVAVKRVPKVPLIVSEWLGKSAAAFLAEQK